MMMLPQNEDSIDDYKFFKTLNEDIKLKQDENNQWDIVFEDYVLFYNQAKSRVGEEDYLVTLPFDAKKGFSREFLAYFAQTLNDVATKGLDDLMDFLADEESTDFALEWDAESFDKGKADLTETTFFAYPRY